MFGREKTNIGGSGLEIRSNASETETGKGQRFLFTPGLK